MWFSGFSFCLSQWTCTFDEVSNPSFISVSRGVKYLFTSLRVFLKMVQKRQDLFPLQTEVGRVAEENDSIKSSYLESIRSTKYWLKKGVKNT